MAAAIVTLVVACASATSPATAQQAERQTVHVVNSGGNEERMKTVRIAKKARARQGVVMSIPPRKLKAMRSGDRVEGMAELEVSTNCTHRMARCVGPIYRYSPFVDIRMVLARGAKATKGPT
jgi:hypothetical protein